MIAGSQSIAKGSERIPGAAGKSSCGNSSRQFRISNGNIINRFNYKSILIIGDWQSDHLRLSKLISLKLSNLIQQKTKYFTPSTDTHTSLNFHKILSIFNIGGSKASSNDRLIYPTDESLKLYPNKLLGFAYCLCKFFVVFFIFCSIVSKSIFSSFLLFCAFRLVLLELTYFIY